jgi:hypothetical protein
MAGSNGNGVLWVGGAALATTRLEPLALASPPHLPPPPPPILRRACHRRQDDKSRLLCDLLDSVGFNFSISWILLADFIEFDSQSVGLIFS